MSGMQAQDLSLYACGISEQPDEKSDCAIYTQSLCGIALDSPVNWHNKKLHPDTPPVSDRWHILRQPFPVRGSGYATARTCSP